MAFAANMIASLKLNNRRKTIHTPFSKGKKRVHKKKTILSKNFTQFEKDLLEKNLKEKRELEEKQKIYKVVISIVLTIISIAGIVFAIELTFF